MGGLVKFEDMKHFLNLILGSEKYEVYPYMCVCECALLKKILILFYFNNTQKEL